MADRRWFFHSFSRHQTLSQDIRILTYPGNPRPAVSSKSNLPCRLERLEELIGLKEGPDAQRIQNPQCDKKQEYIPREGNPFDLLDGAVPESL